MSSPDDLLSAQKNAAAGINGVINALNFLSGKACALEAAASTLVSAKAGWCARVSVIVAGSTSGALYDAATVANAVTGKRIALVPNALGIIDIKLPFANGLVFIPGTGMTATISYS